MPRGPHSGSGSPRAVGFRPAGRYPARVGTTRFPDRRFCGALCAGLIVAAACAPSPPPPVAPTAPSQIAGPLRLFTHADPPVELLVFDHRRSRGLVASLGPVLDAVNRERAPGAPALELTVLAWRHDRGAARVEAERTPVRRIALSTRFDVWLQDFAELALAPAAGGAPRLMLVDPQRGVGLERFAPELALRWGARWVRLPPAPDSAASGAGNVEALPGGWLLLGSTLGEAMARFWIERGFADRHLRIDTSWLAVGHVDEIVSHVVTGPGPCDFALVRAAPARALALAAADPGPPRWLRLGAHRTAQQHVLEARIAGEIERVLEALASREPVCATIPVVELPVLFRCDGEPATPQACRSERPNPVNMTVLDRHLLVPDPRHGPFAREIRRALEPHGQRVHLLDADSPHERRGGLHCAMAVRRVPSDHGPAVDPDAAATLVP